MEPRCPCGCTMAAEKDHQACVSAIRRTRKISTIFEFQLGRDRGRGPQTVFEEILEKNPPKQWIRRLQPGGSPPKISFITVPSSHARRKFIDAVKLHSVLDEECHSDWMEKMDQATLPSSIGWHRGRRSWRWKLGATFFATKIRAVCWKGVKVSIEAAGAEISLPPRVSGPGRSGVRASELSGTTSLASWIICELELSSDDADWKLRCARWPISRQDSDLPHQKWASLARRVAAVSLDRIDTCRRRQIAVHESVRCRLPWLGELPCRNRVKDWRQQHRSPGNRRPVEPRPTSHHPADHVVSQTEPLVLLFLKNNKAQNAHDYFG